MSQANIGLIGLAVMGQNLVLNLERNGYTVAVFNRTTALTDDFVGQHPGKKLLATRTPTEFVASLERPRRILIMVKAGSAVDAVIDGCCRSWSQATLLWMAATATMQTPTGAATRSPHAGSSSWASASAAAKRGALGPEHHARRQC